MMGLRPLRANMALDMQVTMGLVMGVMAPTTPTGLPTLMTPVPCSRSMMPTDFLSRRDHQMILALFLFLAILSGTLPSLVSSTASLASSSALSNTALAQAFASASTCSWV